jgi:hypothetical protein
MMTRWKALKMLQLTAFSGAIDLLCGGRRLVVVSFSASTATNET